MDKDFMQYVYARIEKALTSDTEYMKIQSDCASAISSKDYASYIEIQDELQAKAEELSYIQGFEDAKAILSKSIK